MNINNNRLSLFIPILTGFLLLKYHVSAREYGSVFDKSQNDTVINPLLLKDTLFKSPIDTISHSFSKTDSLLKYTVRAEIDSFVHPLKEADSLLRAIKPVKFDSLSHSLKPDNPFKEQNDVLQGFKRPDSSLLQKVQLPSFQSPVSRLKGIDSTTADHLQRQAAGFLPTNNIKSKTDDLLNAAVPLKSVKGAVTLRKLTVANEGQLEQAYLGGGYYYLNNLQLNGGIEVAKMPLNLIFLHQDLFQQGYQYKNTFQISFDKDAYIDNYRKKLQQQLTPDQLVPKDSALHALKGQAEAGIRSQMDSLLSDYRTTLNKGATALDTIKDFTNQDVNGVFRSLLSSSYVKAIKEKEALLKQLQDNAGDPAQMIQLKNEISAYYKLVAIYNRFQQLKKKYDLTGLQKKLDQETTERKKQYDQLMSKPESVKELAKDKLQLSGFEQLLMSVQKLNIGQHTISLSQLSLYNYLNKGVSIEILNKNRYIFLMKGKEQDLNAIYDRALFTSLFNNDHTATGFRIGKGSLEGNHTHLSFFSFKQSKSYSDAQTLQVPEKSTIVMGLSNRFEVSGSSAVEIELSRSSAAYKNAVYEIDTSIRRTAFHGLLSGSNLFEGIAATAKYSGNFKEEGLNVIADISHVAAGYYNPGNPFLSRGVNTGSLQVKKILWKKKLVVNARTNIRQYKYTTLTSTTWWNYSYLLDVTLKLKNGQQTGVKYQPSRGVQVSDGHRLLQNASDIVTVNLNLQRLIGGSFYRNAINTVYNNSRYLQFSVLSVKTLTFSSMQNITLKENLLYWNNTYTYALQPSAIAYLNTAFNSDAGITYKIGKDVNVSSALTYSSITGYVRQVGCRQTFSATLHKKIETSFYIDARLNIKEYTTYYGEPLTANWSIKYSL